MMGKYYYAGFPRGRPSAYHAALVRLSQYGSQHCHAAYHHTQGSVAPFALSDDVSFKKGLALD
jgi:hypothetical protein